MKQKKNFKGSSSDNQDSVLIQRKKGGDISRDNESFSITVHSLKTTPTSL